MFYIFNDQNICIASCSFEPNTEDLESRSEFCVESETFVGMGYIYDDGVIRQELVEDPVDYEVKARVYRNSLRDKIDDYLKPASTIEDEFVTEEQKKTLAEDSLLLACWPATVDWPYIPLPHLSDLTNSLLNNPTWIYSTIEGPVDGN